MKKIIFLIVIIFTICKISAQGNIKFGTDETSDDFYFAFKIMPNFNNKLVQYALIKNTGYGDYEIFFLAQRNWVLQLTGNERSLANPNKENLLLKHKVIDIPDDVSTKGEEKISDYTISKTINTLNNLWRLRYCEYPYPHSGTAKGWARHKDPKVRTLPSDKQYAILRTYGIEDLNNFFYGENAYRLLKDIRNKAWRTDYKQSIDDNNNEPSSKKE